MILKHCFHISLHPGEDECTLEKAIMNELTLPAIFMVVAIVVGDFGNLSILWATIRNKNLRSPCNIFIAANALADSLSQSGAYFTAILIFSDTHIQRLTCFYTMALPLFGSSCGLCFTLAIGVDRFLGITMPNIYRKLNQVYYIGLCVLLSFIFSGELTYFNFMGNLDSANDSVVCFNSMAVHRSVYTMRNFHQGIMCGLIFIAYASIWIYIWKKNGEVNAVNSAKKIMKPLTVIMFIVIFTWPVTVVMLALIRTYVPPESLTKVSLYSMCLFFFGISCHYFVFFIFSKDYKQAFLNQLSFLPCVKNSSQSPVATLAYTKTSSHSKKNKALRPPFQQSL